MSHKVPAYKVTATIKFSAVIPDCESENEAIEQAYQELSSNLDSYFNENTVKVKKTELDTIQ